MPSTALAVRRVPSLAFRVPSMACALAAQGEPVAADQPQPVRIVARSPNVIEHLWWGPLVHDLAGMQPFERVSIDYQHDPCTILGYVDAHEVAAEGLVLTGALTPFQPDDRCSEVLAKARAGVPYEASIRFDPLTSVFEYLPENYQATVNGMTVEGPVTIVRQWRLMSVAICQSGADPDTATELSAEAEALAAAAADLARPIVVELLSVTDAQPIAPPAEKPDELAPPPPASPAAAGPGALASDGEPAGDADRTAENDGAADGEGLAAGDTPPAPPAATPPADLANQVAALRAELDAFRVQNEELRQQLAAAVSLTAQGAGEANAPAFDAADKGRRDPRHDRLVATYGENLAATIAGQRIVRSCVPVRR